MKHFSKKDTMKNLITMLALSGLMGSCVAQQNSGDGFTVNGTWSGGKDGDTVFCVTISQVGVIPTDTAYVKGGKFKMELTEKSTALKTIVALKNGGAATAVELIVTPQGSANVELPGSPDAVGKVTGNKDNEIWQSARAKELDISLQAQALLGVVNDTTRDLNSRLQAKQKIDSLSTIIAGNYYTAIIDNMPSPVCGLMLRYFGDEFDNNQIGNIVEQMSKKMPDDPVYKALVSQRNADQETAVGKQFKELALVDLSGNMKRLSDVVKSNKLTLIDFWASWCAPCRAEMPNVKRIYEAYHPKGLEIYGVSLDDNMVTWQNAVTKMQMPWIQVSDLDGWSSAAAQAYNIKAIPATVLIDADGTIIAKNVRGQELAKKVAEILGN